MKLSDTVDLLLKHKGREIWSVSPDQSVYEAIEKTADKGVGALQVISEGGLVGIISERDYARKVILKGRSSKETQVKEIMTSPVFYVTRQQTVDQCMGNKLPHTAPSSRGRRAPYGRCVDRREVTIQQLEHYTRGKYSA